MALTISREMKDVVKYLGRESAYRMDLLKLVARTRYSWPYKTKSQCIEYKAADCTERSLRSKALDNWPVAGANKPR